METDHVNQAENSPDMLSLRAPLAKGLTTLDRSLFTKTLSLAAASVVDKRHIAKYRKQLQSSNDLFSLPRISPIRDDPSEPARGQKCLILRPGIKAQGLCPFDFYILRKTHPFVEPDTWGNVVREGVEAKELRLNPYELQISYPSWTYCKSFNLKMTRKHILP